MVYDISQFCQIKPIAIIPIWGAKVIPFFILLLLGSKNDGRVNLCTFKISFCRNRGQNKSPDFRKVIKRGVVGLIYTMSQLQCTTITISICQPIEYA